jgi:putative transposase
VRGCLDRRDVWSRAASTTSRRGATTARRSSATEYARYWNRRHGHSGHLFRNDYDSKAIQSESHLVATVRYVDLNPVRARMTFRPEQWRWSSSRCHVGLEHPPSFLPIGAFHALLAPTASAAHPVYRRLVRDGHVPVSDTGFDGRF